MRGVASALFLTLLASTTPTRGAAQTQPEQNAAYVELLGSGGVWSANLESSFDGGERTRFATLTGILGYRYQKPDGRFVFRAVLTPMYGLGTVESAYPDKGFFPSLGLSFGTAF